MTPSNVTNSRIRCSIQLNKEQEQAVTEYLTRSTCFWNFLMYHLRNEFNEYIESNGSQEAYTALCNKANKYLDLINYPVSEEESENDIEAAWKDFLPQMRELSSDSLQCRLRDFIDALVSYLKQDSVGNAQRPKVKTERSAQAVSFLKPSFTIIGNLLQLKGSFPIEFEVPELSRVSFDVNEVLIGKKANIIFESDSKYGPAKQEGHFFMIASN